MIGDRYTSPYIRIYAIAVGLFFIFIVSGALWLSGTPLYSITYLSSLIKRPLYTAELYLETRGASTLSLASETQNDRANSVPILVYHGVLPKDDNSEINLTNEAFKEHLFALKKAGYTTITLDELHGFIRGEQELPARSVMITFDDGRTDSFYNADPVLYATGFNAVMYLIGMFTESKSEVGVEYYLTDSEAEMLAESERWEIGSHSFNGHRQIPTNADGTERTYFYGGAMWLADKGRLETLIEFRERVTEDLETSQELLETVTGEPIRTLAFPFGNYGNYTLEGGSNAQIMNIVLGEARKYYDLLFYQSSPHQYFTQAYEAGGESSDSTLVRRITMTSDISAEELIVLLESGAAKSFPFTAAFTKEDGWVNAWGEHRLSADGLVLDAEGRRSGAAAVLDGTRHWTDYRVDASVSSDNWSNVVLMMRHDNEGDTIACNYGRDFVHINQRVDGIERVIRGVDNISVLPDTGPVEIAAEVNGRTMRCYLGGELIVETQFLDPSLTRGGTGFKTWNQSGNAHIVVHRFSVSEPTPLP